MDGMAAKGLDAVRGGQTKIIPQRFEKVRQTKIIPQRFEKVTEWDGAQWADQDYAAAVREGDGKGWALQNSVWALWPNQAYTAEVGEGDGRGLGNCKTRLGCSE